MANPFRDEWDFLCRAVWTRDEASGKVRQFPTLEELGEENRWEYLRYLTYEAPKHKAVILDKSRRMLITWWGMARGLYYTLTRPNQANWVMSDKLEKSAYLLGEDRMLFIYEHIPPVSDAVAQVLRSQGYDVEPFLAPVWPNKPILTPRGRDGRGWDMLSCDETGSFVEAVARGATQMQQYTASWVFCDEFSRWEWAEESWTALVPTIEGGGRVEVVGTAELGAYMYDLMHEEE